MIKDSMSNFITYTKTSLLEIKTLVNKYDNNVIYF